MNPYRDDECPCGVARAACEYHGVGNAVSPEAIKSALPAPNATLFRSGMDDSYFLVTGGCVFRLSGLAMDAARIHCMPDDAKWFPPAWVDGFFGKLVKR